MKICFLAVLLAFATSAFGQAANVYIAQSQAGTADGSNCANAKAIAFFNTGSNWGNNSTQIGPGSIVHLCGTTTIPNGTSGLTFAGSGTPGHPITLLFESGAVLQAGYFAQDPGGGIACVNRNYITIDGGSNGLVQATANGTAQANQRGSNGVFLQSCNNVEVKNLRLSNLYVRTPNSSDSCDCGFGLRSVDGNNLNVHNNTVNDAEYGIYYRYDGTTDTGIVIQHNTIYHTATGIVVGDGSAGAAVSDVDVNDNEIYDQYFWDSPGDIFHCDGIHTWATNSGSTTSNMRIFGNYVHGNMGGHLSGFIYSSAVGGSNDGLQIFNNLLTSSTSCATNGYIFIWEASAARIYENTLVGPGGNTCMGIWHGHATIGADIKNNIFSGVRTAIYTPAGGGPIGASDYNLINCTGNLAACMINQDTTFTLAGWRSATGFDTHSLGPNTAPNLAGNFQPLAGSPTIDAGATLGAPWDVDRSGTVRPQGAGYDIGAYEVVTGAAVRPLPPVNLTAVVH